MSIAFPLTDSGSTLDRLGAGRVTSPARLAANRRNAQRSTGPKTIEGKRRSSRNAMKHGLCRSLSCLPTECEATFSLFVDELREELHPATAMQRLAFNQIASLTWRLERLPEAQSKIFEQELAKVEPQEQDDAAGLSPSDVLARRFSDDPTSNGFALMERYERGMRNQLMRLMRQFEQLKRTRPRTPGSNEEFEARQAKYEQQLRDDEEGYAANRARHAREEAARAGEDAVVADGRGGSPPAAAGGTNTETDNDERAAERTQSEPTGKRDSEQPAGKCAASDALPVTERSQGRSRAGAAGDDARERDHDETERPESPASTV